jgi:hypothetical protein
MEPTIATRGRFTIGRGVATEQKNAWVNFARPREMMERRCWPEKRRPPGRQPGRQPVTVFPTKKSKNDLVIPVNSFGFLRQPLTRHSVSVAS